MKKYGGFFPITARDGGEGGDTGDWREGLPEDIKTHQSIKDTKNVASLAKQFVDQQRYLASSVRIPGEDAGDEDRNKFRERVIKADPALTRVPNKEDEESVKQFFRSLGMPETKDQYSIEGIQIEGLTGEDSRVEMLRTMAAEAGLTQDQFRKLAGNFLTTDQNNKAQQAQAIKESRDALISEWGMAFDNNTAMAVDALKKTGAPKGIIEAAENGTLGGDTLKWAHGLAKALGSESTNFDRDDKRSDSAMTPQEALEAIREIQNNPKHPYYNQRDPLHKAAEERFINLHRMAYPER